jgi:hypothetical protein
MLLSAKRYDVIPAVFYINAPSRLDEFPEEEGSENAPSSLKQGH